MNYILFDDKSWVNLLPLTFTRPVCEVRSGILTIREKWEKFLNVKMSHLTQEYLQVKYRLNIEENNILINGSVTPNRDLINSIQNLNNNDVLVKNNKILAVRLLKQDVSSFDFVDLNKYNKKDYEEDLLEINWTWDIFKLNGENIKSDFDLITKDRKSAKLSTTNNVLAAENIFIEDGAKIEYATLNATEGPIYIANEAEIMENSVIRGPFALGDHLL